MKLCTNAQNNASYNKDFRPERCRENLMRICSLIFTYNFQDQKGHILDDEDLITTLKQSKLTSAEVFNRLQLSEENEAKTEAARSRYLPVATRGAVLYFALADLEVLNPMYQFSLQWFTDMFLQCVGK